MRLEDEYWRVFAKTGQVKDYLNYSAYMHFNQMSVPGKNMVTELEDDEYDYGDGDSDFDDADWRL